MMVEVPNQIIVSLVIVNWNTKDLLDACLKSVYEQTNNQLIEIIIIDNDSSDDSCDMVKVKYPDVILIENDGNSGFSAANNQGFEIARGKYVLMLNSDTVILDNAIGKVLDYAEQNQDVAVLGCKLYYPDMRFQSSCFRFPNIASVFFSATYLSQLFKKSVFFNQDRYGECEWFSEKDVDCVMGSFFFMRKSVLEKVGYLDTNYFMYGEEADLCYRIKRAGWKIRFYPNARIIHVYKGSQKGPESVAWSYIAGICSILLFIAKNKSLIAAYFCNILMLIMLLPRTIIWGGNDLLYSIQNGTCVKRSLLKAKIFRHHFNVLFKPTCVFSKGEGR